jgi:hypothetical protein
MGKAATGSLVGKGLEEALAIRTIRAGPESIPELAGRNLLKANWTQSRWF